ncbi:MAG: hypothetical protein M0R73_04705 [Dehalococcoidia bacterium]|nr:hypothetical protein [Dehalococcoidia bacterium]
MFREDAIRTYRVDEVLKGESAAEVEVWSSNSINDRSEGARSQRFLDD